MDKVEHFEIPADDVERALGFYKAVFSWEPNPVPGVKYERLLTIRIDESFKSPRPFGVNGAIIKRSKVVINPVITISVVNMDETLRMIEKENGKIIQGKTEFGDRG